MFQYEHKQATNDAAEDALRDVKSLRPTLDFIRATTSSENLRIATNKVLNSLAALVEELQNSQMAELGEKLINAVRALESEHSDAEQEPASPISKEYQMSAEVDQRGLDRDRQSIGEAWAASYTAADLKDQLTGVRAATLCGELVALALLSHYEEIREQLG